MLPILSPAESAELDRLSAERGVTVESLMENAGRAVAKAAVDLADGAYGRRAAVVCGKGNNGGDGLAAAWHLSRWGMGVTVVLLHAPGAFQGPARSNLERFASSGGRWRVFSEAVLAREIDRADVVVDAVFGTGFHGRPDGSFARAIELINERAGSVVSVDIPSGVEGESGAVRAEAVFADVTVTMGALKPGVVFHPGAEYAGVVEVADIGFPPDLLKSDLLMMEGTDVGALSAAELGEGTVASDVLARLPRAAALLGRAD